jgi:hypothetical protein
MSQEGPHRSVSAPAAKEATLAEADFESDDSGQEDRSIDSNVSSVGQDSQCDEDDNEG